MIYGDLVEEFPREMREPMFRLIDRLMADLSDSPKRSDFHRLESLMELQGQSIVALVQAQTRTEQRLEALTQRVEELAQAQTRTEQRVEELTQAQKRTDQRLEALTQRVEELAQAQTRTEQRVEELAQAQKRTEQRVEELAQAQTRTEQRLEALTHQVGELVQAQKGLEVRMHDIQKQVGRLSHTVGYRLEDEAIWALPRLLARDHSIEVLGDLRRDFLSLSGGKLVELNIFGEGVKEGNLVTILGEAKTQLKKRDVDAFQSFLNDIQSGVPYPVVPLLITYQTSPQVKQYALEKGFLLFFSFQLRPVS